MIRLTNSCASSCNLAQKNRDRKKYTSLFLLHDLEVWWDLCYSFITNCLLILIVKKI